jgi:hypothetical protein
VSAFENNFDIALVQLIANETNAYAQKKSEASTFSHFTLGLGSGKIL